MSKILFILTSRTHLANEDAPAGSWLEEVAAPYYTFKDAGYDVILASPKGGEAPIDPNSLEEPWLTDAGQRFLQDPEAQAALKSSHVLGDVDHSDLDGVFMVGGAAVMWDFPSDPALGKVVTELATSNRLVAAVCHGVVGLQNSHLPKDLMQGKQITCISDKEDELAGFDKIVPFMPEGRFREMGLTVTLADEPFGVHVERSGMIVTGQNPASAGPCAQAALEVVNEKLAVA